MDPSGLDEVLGKALQNAHAAKEDVDFPGLPEPASLTPCESFDSTTANYSPAMRARAVGVVCRLAGEKSLGAFGALSTGYVEIAICNTSGVFAYHLLSQADFQARVMSDDSAGHAQASGWRMGDIPVEALVREAIEKAERGRNPRAVSPGEYSVVCNPYVTADTTQHAGFHRRRAGDGRRTAAAD